MPQGLLTSIIFKYSVCAWRFMQTFRNRFEYWSNTYQSHNKTKQSKKDEKDRESIQSNTTHAPGYQWESNELTIRHHK